MQNITWKKSSLSAHNGGCVEIGTGLPGSRIAIRDSKRPGEGAHTVSPAAFDGFLADVRGGRFGS